MLVKALFIPNHSWESNYIKQMTDSVNTGDNAWVMLSSCLVMLMTPGNGQLKNLLSTIACYFLIFCIVSITWGLIGFSIAFTKHSGAAGLIRDCAYCGLRIIAMTADTAFADTPPLPNFFPFQTFFRTHYTCYLYCSVIGPIRVNFLIVLTVAFNIIVYSPIAFWMWNHEGWAYKMGAIGFAGGNVIHIPAGFAGLASAVYLGHGEKKTYKQNSAIISLNLIMTAILWIGWFGFNGGSALASGRLASQALVNSHIAACSAGIYWAAVQYITTKYPSIVGWFCGAVCGLVAITPAAGYVPLQSTKVIGSLGGIFSYLFCHFKPIYFEDLANALVVFVCHGISAIWGVIATGLFASTDSTNKQTGAFYGNGCQYVLAIVVAAAYSFVVKWLLYFLLGKVMEAKVSQKEGPEGLDKAIHGQQNDPLTQKKVINIIKSSDNLIYTDINSPIKEQVSLQIIETQKALFGGQIQPKAPDSQT